MLRVTPNHNGRLGNHFFRNCAAHLIAQRQQIPVRYSTTFEDFGLFFYTHDLAESFPTAKELSESDALRYAETTFKKEPLSLDSIYCQTPQFVHYIYEWMQSSRDHIQACIPHDLNTTVFVHVRLDDAKQWNPGLSYYETALQSCSYSKGYISSDSPHDPLVQHLQTKFGLTLVHMSERETWKLGCACRYVILSHGTFSWVLGAFASVLGNSVVYPKTQTVKWHGDIFSSMPWTAL